MESRDQTGGNLRFAGVQRCDLPNQWQRSRSVDGVQFVPFGVTTASASPGTVGIFAVTSNGQRFSVHDDHQASLSQSSQALLHNIHPSMDFGRSQSATDSRLRGQCFPRPQVFRPIFRLAGPCDRSFVQRSPKENHHDLEVKESAQVSKGPKDQTSCQIGIMPTRVRVPCLISLKKGVNKISMCANSPIFPAPPRPMLADA
jgi:hypothetical protein